MNEKRQIQAQNGAPSHGKGKRDQLRKKCWTEETEHFFQVFLWLLCRESKIMGLNGLRRLNAHHSEVLVDGIKDINRRLMIEVMMIGHSLCSQFRFHLWNTDRIQTLLQLNTRVMRYFFGRKRILKGSVSLPSNLSENLLFLSGAELALAGVASRDDGSGWNVRHAQETHGHCEYRSVVYHLNWVWWLWMSGGWCFCEEVVIAINDHQQSFSHLMSI